MRTANKYLAAAGVVVCAACAAAWVDAAAPASTVTPVTTAAAVKPEAKNADVKNAAKGKAPLPAWFTPELLGGMTGVARFKDQP